MSVVSENVQKIRNAKYGEEVRSAISDSIEAIADYASGDVSQYSVDYSKNANVLNIIDPNRTISGKRYSSAGIIDDANFVSLDYLVPVHKNDVIYQTKGYLHFSFFDNMYAHIKDADTTTEPYTIDCEASYLGIGLDVSSGAKMQGRTVRINNPIIGEGIASSVDVLYSPIFAPIDYSKNENVLNLIDPRRIKNGYKYEKNGLVENDTYESLDYLIPVNHGDTIYVSGGGYLDIAAYDRYGSFIKYISSGLDPFVVDDAELLGVSISIHSGATLADRCLRINHSFVNAIHSTFFDKRYLTVPTILLDFDEYPTTEDDSRFSILDKYGWTATIQMPIRPECKDMIGTILDHGWSLSLYSHYPDGMNPNTASDDEFYNYVKSMLSTAYNYGISNPIQWSARQNLSFEGLKKALIKCKIPVVRWNTSNLSNLRISGNFIELEACEISSSRLDVCKNRINKLIDEGNGVLNIYTHKLYKSSESGESWRCPEDIYLELCDYLKEKEKYGMIEVSNSTRWFSKAFPDRDHVYRDYGLYNMMNIK